MSAVQDRDPIRFGGPAVWVRMFYLSAVTITTLGFGDIVPVSDCARFMVATEVVIGVVLIGIFLNALWKKEGSSNPAT